MTPTSPPPVCATCGQPEVSWRHHAVASGFPHVHPFRPTESATTPTLGDLKDLPLASQRELVAFREHLTHHQDRAFDVARFWCRFCMERLAKRPPDADCVTRADGECVAEGPCMHAAPSAEPPSEPRRIVVGPNTYERFGGRWASLLPDNTFKRVSVIADQWLDHLAALESSRTALVEELRDARIRVAELETLCAAHVVTIGALNARLPEFARLHTANRALTEEVGRLREDAMIVAGFIVGWWPGLEDGINWGGEEPDGEHPAYKAAERLRAALTDTTQEK